MNANIENSANGDTLASNLGVSLTFVDFFPVYRRKTQGWFFQVGYETFSELFAKINAWLTFNQKWKVKCLETVQYDQTTTFGRKLSSFSGSSVKRNSRGVRLWLVPKSSRSAPQKLGCINVIPKKKTSNQNETNSKCSKNVNEKESLCFENLDEMTKRLNDVLSKEPLDGKILCTETVPVPVTANGDIDVECSYWSNTILQNCSVAFILRVYYEHGPPANELLTIDNFTPSRELWDSPLAVPNYEPFGSVLKRASQSIQEKCCSSVRFLNCQSIDLPLFDSWNSKESEVDYRNMFFKKSKSDFLLKFIRVFYATENTEVNCDKLVSPPKPVLLNCKIFVPAKLGPQEYEDCIGTKRKMEAWLTATGAHIVSAETSVIKLSYSTSSIAASVDSMFTSLSSNSEGSHWIVIYRIYIDGQYLEPPLRVLPSYPQDPEPDEQSCTIS